MLRSHPPDYAKYRHKRGGEDDSLTTKMSGEGLILATSNQLDLVSTSSSRDQPQSVPAPPAPRGLKSLSNTHILIATNVLIFLAMLFHSIWLSGVQRFLDTPIGARFDSKLLLSWGSDYGPLTLGGQYWRILTCLFVHFNIFHLGGNMLFLWLLGKQLDRYLSRAQTLVIYMFTGAASSLASLAWHPTFLSAGSSGAIFGQAAVLIALLGLPKLSLPRGRILGTMLLLVFLIPFQLLSETFSKRTDYAAHAGGLVSGLVIGILLAWVFRSAPLERAACQRRVLAVVAFTRAVSFGGVIAMRYNAVRQYRQGLEVKAFLIAIEKEKISKNPNDVAAHRSLAFSYFMQSEYDEAAK